MGNETGDITGIWVSSVKAGSPADMAGIQAGDIITAMASLTLAMDGSMADYCDILRTHGTDATLDIEVLRYATSEVLQGQINGRELEAAFSFAEEYSAGGGTEAGYSSYRTITDDFDAVSVEVPVEWADVDGRAWSYEDETIGASVYAATDLDGFLNSWSTPGLIFNATSNFSVLGGVEQLLNQERDSFDQYCTLDGRYDYDDSVYAGQYDIFFDCGGTDTKYVVLAAVPSVNPSALLAMVEVQIVSDRDYEALDHVLNSFQVIGELPGLSTAGPAGGYRTISDNYGSIQVDIPNTWTDVDGTEWVYDDEVVGASIIASADVDSFMSSWSQSGMLFRVSDDIAKLGGYVQLLDAERAYYQELCELESRYNYEDPLYEGKYDLYKKCGGSGGPYFIVLSARPIVDKTAFLMLVEVLYEEGENEIEVVSRILDSFQVIGTLP
jgi:hypothetical protein